MLKVSMEFSKGILFIRLKGDVNETTVKDIIDRDFKYIVLNIDDIYSIDTYSINYLSNIYNSINNSNGKLILCDKFNLSRKLFNNIPKINNEIDAYKLFERMV